jgi:hypothetical protein
MARWNDDGRELEAQAGGRMNRVYLTSDYATTKAHGIIDQYSRSGFVMELREPTRTDDQNRKLWPMLQDLKEQVERFAELSTEDIKLIFLNALGREMRWLPCLDGRGQFPVGLRSSTLTKDQFSLLIELIYAEGAKHGVIWSDPAERIAA